MIAPCEFIPLAEETGLIVEIGNRVLYKACVECQRWPDDTAVAVNFSPIQFERSDVPAIVRETLDATRLPANRLEIEITESTLLRDSSRTIADLRRLEELGVTISVDDFGTAYSSLSYLHSLPLHKVKIDQSFLQGVGSNERRVTLLRGMARLSTQLGLRVVVEGVETEDQLEGGAADVFGPGSGNGAAHPAVDVKSLHAKIGELTLENDFLEGALSKAGHQHPRKWTVALRREMQACRRNYRPNCQRA